MESSSVERTLRYLTQLLRYLENIHSSMDWESGGVHGLPPRIVEILSDSGYLEGLHLKAQGCLSSDLQEFIRAIGYAFEIEAAPHGAFKLPFVDNEMALQRKTLNAFMEKAWMVYHAALLSAYTLKPLVIGKKTPPGSDGLEEIVRIQEAPEGEAPVGTWTANGGEALAPGTAHKLNNALTGIMSYVSLILEERKKDKDLQAKLGLVLEASKKASSLIASAQKP